MPCQFKAMKTSLIAKNKAIKDHLLAGQMLALEAWKKSMI
jgi:hypothetical protein